jgi:glutamate carboxypeptidase
MPDPSTPASATLFLMPHPTQADLLRVLSASEPRLLQRLRQLVESFSESGSKRGVEDAGKLVECWLKTTKYKLKKHPNSLYGNVLEFQFGPARSKRGRVLLLGHLDTVWPLETAKTMPWRESDGKIFGPGILDMKAGIVMAIEALAALQEVGIDRPVTLLLVSEEEVGSPISRPITEQVASKCSAVFVLEPAQLLAYKTARKGIGNYHLRVEGIASHSGVDFEKGHSAILEMAHLIHQISTFTDQKKGVTVNPGVIQGGTRSNVIAAECSIEVDVRIARASDAPRLDRLFKSLKTKDKACKLTVTGGMNRPPMERKPGTVKLFRLAQQLAQQQGFTLEEASTGGGSDGNFTAALNIPTLDGMGAVGAGAPASHEHIVTKHLLERTALLAGMIAAAE